MDVSVNIILQFYAAYTYRDLKKMNILLFHSVAKKCFSRAFLQNPLNR